MLLSMDLNTLPKDKLLSELQIARDCREKFRKQARDKSYNNGTRNMAMRLFRDWFDYVNKILVVLKRRFDLDMSNRDVNSI